MKNGLKEFEINFSGLKLGDHDFEYQLGNKFFEHFGYQEYNEADFTARLVFTKKENALGLQFSIAGKVKVPCDITGELFWLPLQSDTNIQVKFGEEYDDSNDEVIIIPHGEHRVNVAQYFYELAVLARPLKVVHPEVVKGKKGQDILRKLEKLSPGNQQKSSEDDEIDPRWNKLKNLLN